MSQLSWNLNSSGKERHQTKIPHPDSDKSTEKEQEEIISRQRGHSVLDKLGRQGSRKIHIRQTSKRGGEMKRGQCVDEFSLLRE